MKTNLFLLLLVLVAGALVGYAFHAAGAERLLTILTAVLSTILLAAGTAVAIEGSPRSTLMMRTAAWCFFVVLLAANVCFALFAAAKPVYVIVDGLIAVAAAGALYLVARSKQ